FITKLLDGNLAYVGDIQAMQQQLAEVADQVRVDFEYREYGRAIRRIMAQADVINQAFDAAQPWVLAKGIQTADEQTRAQLQDICSRALAGFKALSVMLTPVLPALTRRVAQELFGEGRDFAWADASILPTSVAPFKHLMQRVEPAMLDQLFEPPAEPQLVPGGEPIAE